MRNSVIHSAIPFIARSIGKKMSTKVVFGHDKACTDNKTIFLPDLPLDDKRTEILGIGYTIHEAAHIRFSDFTITEKPSNALHAALWGVIEDVRIEMATIKEYPGAKDKLQQLVKELIDCNFFKPTDPQQGAGSILQGYALYQLRGTLLEQDALLPMATEAYQQLVSVMTPACLTRTLALLSTVKNLTCEREAFDLAKRIVEVIEEESKKQPPPPQQNNDANDDNKESPSQQDDKADTPPNQSDDSAPNDGTTPKTSGDELNKEGIDTTPTDDQIQGLKDMLATNEDDLPEDMKAAISELLGDAIETAEDNGKGAVPGDGRADLPPLPLGDNAQVLMSARASASALRTRLLALLQASKTTRRATSRRGRRINGRKIVRIKQNNPNIFKSVSRKKGMNTSVQILLDRSISMEDSMELATSSCLALASSLDSMNELNVAAAAFPGRQHDVEPLTLMNEKVAKTASRYPSIRASGGTPLLPALMWATHQLLAQKEERKILLVITDGAPYEMALCQDVIKRLNQSGIEVLGLGIDTDSITKLIPNSRCIQSVDELASSMFDMFKAQLAA